MREYFLTLACAGITAAAAGYLFDGKQNESMARYIRFAFALCILCITVFPLLRFVRSPNMPALSFPTLSDEDIARMQSRSDDYVIEQTRRELIAGLSERIAEKTGIMPRSVDIQFTKTEGAGNLTVTVCSVDIVTDCPSDALAEAVKEWIGVYPTLRTPETEEEA